MPGPPPPPPPGPPPPPHPLHPLPQGAQSKAPGAGRDQLLSSIRAGARLKKTVTVDKSGPYIPGAAGSTGPTGAARAGPPVQNGGVAAAPPGLGGLFAGGMPKLRSTGKLVLATTNGTKTEAPSIPRQAPPFRTSPDKTKTVTPSYQYVPPSNQHTNKFPSQPAPPSGGNVSQLTAVLSETLSAKSTEGPARTSVRRQASEVRARGPPPQPPVQKQNMPLSSSDSVLTTSSLSERISSLKLASSGAPPPPSEPRISHTPLQRNKSALHGGGGGISPASLGGSMTSLTSAPPTPTPNSQSLSTSDLSSEHHPIGRVPSHGKPNLAPKPPTFGAASETRPSPPLKKLTMNGKVAHRAQSMRAPRSPPVSPPSPQPGSRPPQTPPTYAPNSHTKMPASHFGTLRATRAPMRPPGVCPPPPPTGPPPAPPARSGSLNAPPPPPPHRQHSHGSNGTSDEIPAVPAPPVRGSSMRHLDLEARFADLFNPPTGFPFPDAFLRVQKGYSSATVVTTSKQQAPPPPLSLPLEGWSGTSSVC